MWFKRKPKEAKPVCFHEYKLVDYSSVVDITLAVESYYEIGCSKCGQKRTVDECVFNEMRKVGLIHKEASE